MSTPNDGHSTAPGEDQVQDPAPIADAVRWLFRTVRTLRSYPIDNEMSRRVLGELTPRLGQVLPFTEVV